jgi:mannose-1-phosphate guanylyltransferase
MKIHYTEEREPLGTIGPLSLLRDRLDDTFLVINGDIVTDLSLNAFLACHRQHGGSLTVATMVRTIKTNFGLIEDTDGQITKFKEKPVLSHLVSMGIYCMEPEVIDNIPSDVPFGFDDLALGMLARDIPIFTFRHNGLWLDIGRVEDFQKAQELNWDEERPAFEVVAAA